TDSDADMIVALPSWAVLDRHVQLLAASGLSDTTLQKMFNEMEDDVLDEQYLIETLRTRLGLPRLGVITDYEKVNACLREDETYNADSLVDQYSWWTVNDQSDLVAIVRAWQEKYPEIMQRLTADKLAEVSKSEAVVLPSVTHLAISQSVGVTKTPRQPRQS